MVQQDHNMVNIYHIQLGRMNSVTIVDRFMWYTKRAIPASYIRIYTNSHLAVFNAWPVHWPQGRRRARADCFNWFIQSDGAGLIWRRREAS